MDSSTGYTFCPVLCLELEHDLLPCNFDPDLVCEKCHLVIGEES